MNFVNQKLSKIVLLALLLLLPACKEDKAEFFNSVRDLKSKKSWGLNSAHEGTPYFVHSELNLTWDSNNPDIITLPQFSFTSHKNEHISEKQMLGKNSIIAFVFTSCKHMCPLIVKNLAELKKNKSVNSTAEFYLVSVDPSTDTPQKLKAFAKKMKVDDLANWHFLTGEKNQVLNLAREVFKADAQAQDKLEKTAFVHTENLYILDNKSRLRGIYNSNSPSDQKKIVDLLNQI